VVITLPPAVLGPRDEYTFRIFTLLYNAYTILILPCSWNLHRLRVEVQFLLCRKYLRDAIMDSWTSSRPHCFVVRIIGRAASRSGRYFERCVYTASEEVRRCNEVPIIPSSSFLRQLMYRDAFHCVRREYRNLNRRLSFKDVDCEQLE
jgi:hypothetical protein